MTQNEWLRLRNKVFTEVEKKSHFYIDMLIGFKIRKNLAWCPVSATSFRLWLRSAWFALFICHFLEWALLSLLSYAFDTIYTITFEVPKQEKISGVAFLQQCNNVTLFLFFARERQQLAQPQNIAFRLDKLVLCLKKIPLLTHYSL